MVILEQFRDDNVIPAILKQFCDDNDLYLDTPPYYDFDEYYMLRTRRFSIGICEIDLYQGSITIREIGSNCTPILHTVLADPNSIQEVLAAVTKLYEVIRFRTVKK
jgi:hypothetical protein